MFKFFFKFFIGHKIIFVLIIAVLASGGYFYYKSKSDSTSEIRYVLASVEKGTLISAISGSGQVSVSNQVDLKTKTSGEVTSLAVKVGQEVKNGALIARLDSSDALKAVRDAETSLETAKLELDEILAPVDELTIMQAENSLVQSKESKQDAEDNLQKAYEDGFNTVANVFLNLPTVMAVLKDILYGYSYVSNQQNIDYYTNVTQTYDDSAVFYKNDAAEKYNKARASYDKNFANYKATSRYSETQVIENLINESYETTKVIAEAVKSVNNLIRFYEDTILNYNTKPQTLADTHLTSLDGYTSKTNTYLTSLLSSADAIKNYQESIISVERSIKEKELSLTKIKAGSDDLTIRGKKIAVQQKQDALISANEVLADCSARAPFAGVVAEVGVKKGDTVSSGATVATLITKQKIAEISLNEIDAAKVKVGQKATLSFDAVSDLTLTGEVIEIDTLGTVSQGVVSYTVKISFDTQDERVKPGMSVSANIIVDMKQDVLMVPNSAIKFLSETSYVELPNETIDTAAAGKNSGIVLTTAPKQQIITIGLTNDSYTEVANGLSEGDQIIARTITPSSSANSTGSANSFSGRASGNTFFMTGGGPAAGSVMIRQ